MIKLKIYEWIIIALIIPWCLLIGDLIQAGHWLIAALIVLITVIVIVVISCVITDTIEKIKRFFKGGNH